LVIGLPDILPNLKFKIKKKLQSVGTVNKIRNNKKVIKYILYYLLLNLKNKYMGDKVKNIIYNIIRYNTTIYLSDYRPS